MREREKEREGKSLHGSRQGKGKKLISRLPTEQGGPPRFDPRTVKSGPEPKVRVRLEPSEPLRCLLTGFLLQLMRIELSQHTPLWHTPPTMLSFFLSFQCNYVVIFGLNL